jgi:hypothetical protein
MIIILTCAILDRHDRVCPPPADDSIDEFGRRESLASDTISARDLALSCGNVECNGDIVARPQAGLPDPIEHSLNGKLVRIKWRRESTFIRD